MVPPQHFIRRTALDCSCRVDHLSAQDELGIFLDDHAYYTDAST